MPADAKEIAQEIFRCTAISLRWHEMASVAGFWRICKNIFLGIENFVDLGFLWEHQRHQGDQLHDDYDNKEEDVEVKDNDKDDNKKKDDKPKSQDVKPKAKI